MFKVFTFGSETRTKTISSLIYRLINELCGLLTIFQSDAVSARGHTSLVSDKHVPALWFQSVSPGAGALVWFSCSQGESSWCIGLLLRCLAAQTVAARHLSSCW